jgi:glycosyltransferase involved in cell wall biosynthesis
MRLGFDGKRVFHNTTGLGNYARDVLRILAAHAPGHELVAYNPSRGRVPFALTGALREARPRGLFRLWPGLWRQVGLAGALARDGIEVFHGLSGELPVGLARSGVPGVVTVHDLIFERFPAWYGAADRRIYRWKAQAAVRAARVVVAISEQTAGDLVHFYGVPRERIRVVYQGCHQVFRRPQPPQRLAAVAARLGVAPGFVLQVGTIEPRKNLLLTARAVASLPGVTLVAVGRPTAYAGEVLAFARTAGLGERLRLLRGVSSEDLAALYQLAGVAVYPSRFEGFGIPIVEALVSGTPVVTTRGGVFPEAGGPGSCYVDPDDADGLREALRSILSDPERRGAMRLAGLAFAERFDEAAIAAGLLAVYAAALGEGLGAAADAR